MACLQSGAAFHTEVVCMNFISDVRTLEESDRAAEEVT